MVLHDFGGYTATIDGYLKNNLDLYKKMVKKKFDLFFIVVGREGMGKSVLTATILRYLDPTFNLSRCYLKGEDFIEALVRADPEKDKFKAYMFDEGQEFTSRAAMSKFNKLLVQVISKIRAKQLYIAICIPNFFELDKYAAIHRANFLCQVYQDKKGNRGGFRFWNWEKKKRLYFKGKKGYNYLCEKPNFRGPFTYNAFPFKQEEYDQKKFDAMEDIINNLHNDEWKCRRQRDLFIFYLTEICGWKQKEVVKLLKDGGYPLTQAQISRILRNMPFIRDKFNNRLIKDDNMVVNPTTLEQ